MNNEKFRQKYLDMIAEVESCPYVRIEHIEKDFDPMSEEEIEKSFQTIEKYDEVKLPEYFKGCFFPSGDLQLEWRYESEEDEEDYVVGEYRLVNISTALSFTIPRDFGNPAWPDCEERDFLKQLLIFENYPAFGGDKYVTFRFVGDNPSPEIWFCYENAHLYYKLSLNYAEYLDCLIDLKSIENWQLLFIEEIKDLSGLNYPRELIPPEYIKSLKNGLEYLPLFFPKGDYRKYYQIFEERYKQKLTPRRTI